MDQKLYKELYNMRAYLKEDGRRKTGRAPLVCNDEALYALAEMEPKRLSDLEGVPGIGRKFIDDYGELFINIVNKHTVTDNEKTVKMNSNATETLKELEKKLVSINRRNRLLYMPKKAAKYAYDMVADDTRQPMSFLFGTGKNYDLCNLERTDPLEGNRFKSAVALIREINRELREKGQNDLYIGYPFLSGRLPGENFDVRCPLVLFPVSVERTSTSITLSIDGSRDTLYNATLLLAFFKFNNITKPLPDMVIDDLNKETFISNLIQFYGEQGIQIRVNGSELKKFRDYSAGEFPSYNVGEMYLENCMVLGKFPVCSSSIQKDFEEMIASGKINNLLNELLLEVNDWDYSSDAFYGDSEKKDKYEKYDVSEKKLIYINDLDSSQENVLSAVDYFDKLVIQGPPGTGKSQVITNLIAKEVSEGKTVLMVSEKKTALDVVYSRLGNLSKYALLIDDVGNKDLFYQQLEKMLRNGAYPDEYQIRLDEIASAIDEKIFVLERIAEKLNSIGKFGIEPYKLYVQNKKINLENPEEVERLRIIRAALTPEIREIKYRDLQDIKQRFSNIEYATQIVQYKRIIEAYPWLHNTKRGLNQIELLDFASDYANYLALNKEYWNKKFFARLFSHGNIIETTRNFVAKYFERNEAIIQKLLYKNPEEIKAGFDQYYIYELSGMVYENQSSFEKEYAEVLYRIGSSFLKISDANEALFQTILFENISAFENENRIVLSDISQYQTVISELAKLIADKKEITKKRLEKILKQSMGNITYAKRNGEIQRLVESRRKWSVNRFISKYSFEIFKSVKVWLLTPEVVSEIIPLETGIFDLVIFDEASQMYVEKGLPSIHRAKKVIIAGDHKQLRPSSLGTGRMGIDEEEVPIDEDTKAALEEESLLDLARFKYQDVMLNFHYRSRYEELIAFSNYAFYKGRLYISPNVDRPEKPPIEYHQMANAMWVNRSNMTEAKFIVALLKDILADRKNEETIGIISFNSNQRDLIMDIIDEQCTIDSSFAAQIRAEMKREKDGEDIGLFIKNIESVQGDERDIIIFSIGYAKNENGRLIRNFGWLNQKGGENRLNVAISRAKTKVHVVASFSPEELQVEDTKNDGPRILKKYLQYSKAISDGDKESAQQVLRSFGDDDSSSDNISFDSEFEIQVYDLLNERLLDKGYRVDTQVGIGGYSIDLAVKKGDKYILGIECDGRMYHSSKSARERDYHRQKYLESRGWRIYRIWSTNWWRNSKSEIDKICNLIQTIE